MVFGEIFLLELGGSGSLCRHLVGHVRVAPCVTLDAVQLAGHKLQTGIMESGTAVVDDGDQPSRSAFFSSRVTVKT